MKYAPLLFVILWCASSCAQNHKSTENETNASQKGQQYSTAYFASGCFWCAESIFESVIGVRQVISGYSGGTGQNPTYQNYEKKGHAEAIQVTYDSRYISYEDLLTVYFSSQNPVQQNGQGPDMGSGYRSIVFYQSEEEKELIQKKIESVQKLYKGSIAAEIKPFKKFWKAEEFHQDLSVKTQTILTSKTFPFPGYRIFKYNIPSF